MPVRRGAVERERNRAHPGVLEAPDLLRSEQFRRARSDRDGQAEPRSGRDEVPQVGPLERVAAGEHHVRERLAERVEAFEQMQTFGGGQLLRIALSDRLCPAMPARQIAGPRELPINP